MEIHNRSSMKRLKDLLATAGQMLPANSRSALTSEGEPDDSFEYRHAESSEIMRTRVSGVYATQKISPEIITTQDLFMLDSMSRRLLTLYTRVDREISADRVYDLSTDEYECLLHHQGVALGYLLEIFSPFRDSEEVKDFVAHLEYGIAILTLDSRDMPTARDMDQMRLYLLQQPQGEALAMYYQERLDFLTLPPNEESAIIASAITPVLMAYYVGFGMWIEAQAYAQFGQNFKPFLDATATEFAASIEWIPAVFKPTDFDEY